MIGWKRRKGREGNAFSRKEGTDGRTQKDTDLIEGNEGAVGMLQECRSD